MMIKIIQNVHHVKINSILILILECVYKAAIKVLINFISK